jgi:hypothetical protein
MTREVKKVVHRRSQPREDLIDIRFCGLIAPVVRTAITQLFDQRQRSSISNFTVFEEDITLYYLTV